MNIYILIYGIIRDLYTKSEFWMPIWKKNQKNIATSQGCYKMYCDLQHKF